MNLLPEFTSYMHEVLGLSVQPEPWRETERMPFYLQDTYQFSRCMLLDSPCLLMYTQTERDINPLALAKHILHVRQSWEGVVLYLCASVSPYIRRRLIEQKISFVIPGNQLYLPPLGVDLHEQYRKKRPAIVKFSPSAQVVILHALCHGQEQPHTASALAKRLGYTRMTMARAFGELETAEVGEIELRGKERLLVFQNGLQVLWELALPRMRTPVKKRIWTRRPRTEWTGLPAGLTALATYTMLAVPEQSVYALSSVEWKSMNQQGFDTDLMMPEQDDNSCTIELWSYSPRIFAEHDIVDPFSLYLSLQEEADERIQSALALMMEQIAW